MIWCLSWNDEVGRTGYCIGTPDSLAVIYQSLYLMTVLSFELRDCQTGEKINISWFVRNQ